MYVANAESSDNPHLEAVLSKWRAAVASTRTGLRGWEAVASSIGQEIGPSALDDLHLSIAFAGEPDFKVGLIERLAPFRPDRKSRGRSYGAKRRAGQ